MAPVAHQDVRMEIEDLRRLQADLDAGKSLLDDDVIARIAEIRFGVIAGWLEELLGQPAAPKPVVFSQEPPRRLTTAEIDALVPGQVVWNARTDGNAGTYALVVAIDRDKRDFPIRVKEEHRRPRSTNQINGYNEATKLWTRDPEGTLPPADWVQAEPTSTAPAQPAGEGW